MPYDVDTEPVVIKVASIVALPPGNVTAAEWAEYKGRVIAIEGLGLVDLSDVDATGLVDGQTLIYNAATDMWKPGTPAGTISQVMNSAGTTVVANAPRLQAGAGLIAEVHPSDPSRARIRPNFASNGTLDVFPRADHIHTAIRRANKAFAAGTTISSGTQTLDSATVTSLTPEIAYLIEASVKGDVRGAGGGAGEVTPRLSFTVGTTTYTTTGEVVRTVAGVDRPYLLDHDSAEITGVSSVTVTATMQFTSGDPTLIKPGRIRVRAFPRR